MQAVIALNTATGKARYAGNKLLGQADENEELLLFDVSEIDSFIMRRYPTEVELYDDLVDAGGGLLRKVQKVRPADTENVRIEREVVLKNVMQPDHYATAGVVQKTFSAQTVNEITPAKNAVQTDLPNAG